MSRIAKMEGEEFKIIKSDNLIIAGYASIEIVDKQNDLITLKALGEAAKQFMVVSKYRNVMTNHSNVQVGEVIKNYRDSTGRLWKTEVDDVGFFVVIKLREDIEKAREVSRDIRKGTLRSFSIGGQALEKKQRQNEELGEYNEISKLELHEVTICEKGINPEAKFDILKMEKVNKMTEIEKALDELNTLLKEVKDSVKKEGEYLDTELEEDMELTHGEEDLELADADEELLEDSELKYDDNDGLAAHMAGEEVSPGQSKHPAIPAVGSPNEEGGNVPMVKGMDAPTLDLSSGNLEKAYAEFRNEQLEKMAYENLQKEFANRFQTEVSVQEENVAKQNYDAKAEVDGLKTQFSDLLKALKDEKQNVIVKQQQVVEEMNIPSYDDISKMEWHEIHATVQRLENII